MCCRMRASTRILTSWRDTRHAPYWHYPSWTATAKWSVWRRLWTKRAERTLMHVMRFSLRATSLSVALASRMPSSLKCPSKSIFAIRQAQVSKIIIGKSYISVGRIINSQFTYTGVVEWLNVLAFFLDPLEAGSWHFRGATKRGEGGAQDTGRVQSPLQVRAYLCLYRWASNWRRGKCDTLLNWLTQSSRHNVLAMKRTLWRQPQTF